MESTVFVVDDERIIADTLAIILNSSGYRARAFYDGQSALDASDVGCPDFIISDVVMPGLGGIEMAIQIRQRFPACQLLLFSGQAATAGLLDEMRLQGHPPFEMLQKPVHPRNLLAWLETRRKRGGDFVARPDDALPGEPFTGYSSF